MRREARRPLLLVAAAAATAAGIASYACEPADLPASQDDITLGPVAFVSHDGVLTQNRVTFCTRALSGTLTASLPPGSGAVLTPTVTITAAPSSSTCASDGGAAVFYWTGTQDRVLWTVAYESTKLSRTHSVPMVGTEIELVDTTTSRWTDPADAGPDSGPAPGPLVDVQTMLARRCHENAADAAADASTDASLDAALEAEAGSDASSDASSDAPSDASSADAASEAAAADASVDASTAAQLCTEPLKNTSVVVTMTGGATPATAAFTTDANGFGFFSFRAPPGATTANTVLVVGGVVARPVQLDRNP